MKSKLKKGRGKIMHFEITKCKIFLGKGLPPYNIQTSSTYLHLDKKKRGAWNLAFLAHQS